MLVDEKNKTSYQGDFTVTNEQPIQQIIEREMAIKKGSFTKDELEASFQMQKNKKAPSNDD